MLVLCALCDVVSQQCDGSLTCWCHDGWGWSSEHTLGGGAPVVVEIKRQQLAGIAEAITDDQPAIAAGLLAQLREHPAVATGYGVPLDAGQPDPEVVRQVARFVVMVRIQLASA
jgi:hypothetical protein